MHISVSYCTLVYVMVYEDSCFQNMFMKGLKGMFYTQEPNAH